MAGVAILSLPQKTTIELDFAKKAMHFGKMVKVNAAVLNQVTKIRNAMIRSKYDPDATDEYMQALVGMLPDGPAGVLRKAVFYYWEACLGPKTSHAAADAVYEAASVLACVAGGELRKVESMVEVMNTSSVERVCKESYRRLLTAAGKYEKAAEFMKTFAKVDRNFPADIHPTILDGLKTLCLAQAQELAVYKSMNNSDNHGAELMAKLTAQVHALYTEAYQLLANAHSSGDDVSAKFLSKARYKASMARIRTFQYMSHTFSKADKTAEAKSAIDQAAELTAQLEKDARQVKMPPPLVAEYKALLEAQSRFEYKVSRDVNMYGRAKAAALDSPVPMIEGRGMTVAALDTWTRN
eukprot:TRINITY_DN2054_c0_g1_i1.p1 TRINITY_DN2054_c0_g1~~TRINITY_DN2054_c0_g1_i1.p1  ORF type:complete len:353 (+),score=70.23 TRINITY_DN2054_c0_g1_i1:116-1174(+)